MLTYCYDSMLFNERSAMTEDSEQYRQKKQFFDSLLTIYGRKPVLEAVQDPLLRIYKLHIADSNKPAAILSEITQWAQKREIPIEYHDKKSLSRISKNGKQDQGIAADIQLHKQQTLKAFINKPSRSNYRLIALDRITNPQNLGMIIRSVCAGQIDGLIIPQKGCAALSSLVIKASTGTIFKAPLLTCQSLTQGLRQLKDQGTTICSLSSHAKTSLFEYNAIGPVVYVLGNETEGVASEVFALTDQELTIPMNNDVESLNVAITAALIAFNDMR